jgi:hypothetical protein
MIRFFGCILSTCFILATLFSYGQGPQRSRNLLDSSKIVSLDSITKKGFKLVFINLDSSFDSKVKSRMTDAFFIVYPQEAERFNKNTLSRVTFIVDPGYNGVAATGNGVARYSPKWLKEHPEDIDVVTHEVMHIVQSYPRGSGPGWLTEGIADYVRHKYGVNNEAGKWALPKYDTSHHYTKSYRITARFLLWLETKVRPSIINELDNAMRSRTYVPEIWEKLTTKSLDQLWDEYAKDPML